MPFDVYPDRNGEDTHGPFDVMDDIAPPSMHLFRGTGPFGVDNLASGLTINGVTKQPLARYKGGDATVTSLPAWGYGVDLPLVSVATPPTYNDGSPYLGGNDDSVLFNASDYYQDAGATVGDITTGDVVIEAVCKLGRGGAATTIASKRKVGANYNGWRLDLDASGLVIFRASDGTAFPNIQFASTDQAWQHIFLCISRGEASANGSKGYINGAVIGAGAHFSGAASTWTTTSSLTIGAQDDGSTPYGSNVAYFALWTHAAWHQAGAAGPTEWAAIAKERYYRLSGVWPQRACGTATPNFFTRATAGYLDKYEADGTRKLYYMGVGSPRVVHRKDSEGTDIKGYLSELAATNLFLQSEDLDSAPNVKTRVTVDTDSLAGPNKVTAMDTIVEDGTAATTHYVTQSITQTDTKYYCFSVFLKKSNRDWVALEAVRSGANSIGYFDLTNGAVGASPANVDSTGIEDWTNGIYRCWIVYLADQTAAADHNIYVAEADNDITFDGLSQDAVYAGYGQMENTRGPPTSYIPTAAASATRNKDQLQYKGDDGNIGGVGSNLSGAIWAKVLHPDHASAIQGNYVEISDGGASANIIQFVRVVGGGNIITGVSVDGGVAQAIVSGPSVDLTDDVVHNVGCKWQTNEFVAYADGTAGTADISGTVPDDLDQIDVGQRFNDTLQPNGVLSDLKFFPRSTATPKGR